MIRLKADTKAFNEGLEKTYKAIKRYEQREKIKRKYCLDQLDLPSRLDEAVERVIDMLLEAERGDSE